MWEFVSMQNGGEIPVSMTFEDGSTWRSRGAPKVEIPDEIADAMDASYEDRKVCVIEAEDDADTDIFIRYLRIYARRCGKKVDTQFFIKDGVSHLRFRMRDARGYTRDIAPLYVRRAA